MCRPKLLSFFTNSLYSELHRFPYIENSERVKHCELSLAFQRWNELMPANTYICFPMAKAPEQQKAPHTSVHVLSFRSAIIYCIVPHSLMKMNFIPFLRTMFIYVSPLLHVLKTCSSRFLIRTFAFLVTTKQNVFNSISLFTSWHVACRKMVWPICKTFWIAIVYIRFDIPLDKLLSDCLGFYSESRKS